MPHDKAAACTKNEKKRIGKTTNTAANEKTQKRKETHHT